MINKKRLAVCGVAVLGVGAYLNTLPVHAAVPQYRGAKTEVVAQYLDDENNYMYDILERDGDADVELPNGSVVNLVFDGDGSFYSEEYKICEDAMCGDVFFTVFDTMGTADHKDDVPIGMKYIGTIVPNNYEVD